MVLNEKKVYGEEAQEGHGQHAYVKRIEADERLACNVDASSEEGLDRFPENGKG